MVLKQHYKLQHQVHKFFEALSLKSKNTTNPDTYLFMCQLLTGDTVDLKIGIKLEHWHKLTKEGASLRGDKFRKQTMRQQLFTVKQRVEEPSKI